MTVGWVASSVRARAMTCRRLGRTAADSLAVSPSLEAATSSLARTPYGHDVRQGQTLAEVQRAVVATVLWNMRVMAGWTPREGATILRVLLAGLEVANVEGHLHRLAGGDAPQPYQLGGLATAWPRLAHTTSVEELCHVLATSRWGDPGSRTPRDIGLAMRTTIADQTLAAVPAAGAWAAGATALLVARTVVLERRELPASARLAASRVLGPAAISASTLSELASALPHVAAWALADVHEANNLWQAEARWWTRVEQDGFALVRRARAGPEVLVGTVALMATDAWRVRAALELAARGGAPLETVYAVA